MADEPEVPQSDEPAVIFEPAPKFVEQVNDPRPDDVLDEPAPPPVAGVAEDPVGELYTFTGEGATLHPVLGLLEPHVEKGFDMEEARVREAVDALVESGALTASPAVKRARTKRAKAEADDAR